MPGAREPRAEPCWADLLTSDLGGAVEFYSRLFGWRFDDGAEARAEGYLPAYLDDQLVSGLVRNDRDSGALDVWTTYLNVADVHAAAFAARLHGGKIHLKPVEIPEQGTLAMISDPEGIGVGLFQAFDAGDLHSARRHGTRIWSELHTKHFDAVARFYREALGWELSTVSDSPEFRYCTLGQGSEALAGIYDIAGQGPEAHAGWRTYFAVDDADASVALAELLGGAVIREPQDSFFGRMAVPHDSTGAEFSIIQPTRHRA